MSMIWPDGGIGKQHDHPFWGTCSECSAASGGEQLLVLLIFNPGTISLGLILLLMWLE